MTLPIDPVAPATAAVSASGGAPPPAAQPVGFGDSLARLVNAVDSSTSAANTAVDAMLEGKGDVHEAMIALQRAQLTFELTVQMRNKVVQAYQEIMRMPV